MLPDVFLLELGKLIDAWNGYHSIPLRESDHHLTTFITPFGLFRYKRAIQGYKSSGDGYNRRLDTILSQFERKERVVDDTVIINLDKLQFVRHEVDFAGFHISDNKIN